MVACFILVADMSLIPNVWMSLIGFGHNLNVMLNLRKQIETQLFSCKMVKKYHILLKITCIFLKNKYKSIS